MKTETSKATARPWRAYGWTVDGADDRPVARAAADYCADTLTTPESAREWSIWNAESKRTDEAASANAALIVERVNGWEALVAERDALREALAALLMWSENQEAVIGRETTKYRVVEAARLALKGGA